MLAGIDDSKLHSTASHPSSSFHSLPRRVLSSRAPFADDYGLSGSYGFSAHIVIRWLAVGFGFGYGYGRK